ncbi:putative ATP-dependent RNA helicase TDRD12, partial [Pseudolycoriella hygida]
ITQTYRIQKVGWPRILRGFSLIIVNNGRAGTTWTYLPAVCSLLIERVQDERIVDGCGPLSIIACASYEEVNEIERRCRHLLRYTNGIKCFKACGFYEDDIVLSQLLNGTEIMVTTVPCLYRLMTHRLQLFNHKRILSLVFDNIDLISKNFRQEICQIYQLCDNDVQTIITSKTWSTLLEHFYIESDRFALCIGSYVEAAVYGRTEMVVEYLSQELKFSKLMSYLCGLNYALELTVLVFSELKDLQRTWKRLQCTPIKFWKCHDNMDSLEILKIKKAIQSCRPGEFKMLICTDETLADLNVCRANHIVHCTLPATWTLFVKRFSVLLGSHENLLTRKRNNKSKTTSIVFVDEKNNKELPRLIEFMEIRGNCDIPENVLNLAELSRMKNEESQTNMYKPFCKRLLTIGICHGQINCPDRHTITKLDRSRSDIPLSGYVKFDILRINSPVHFTVRLRQHRDTNESKWKNCQSSNSVSAFQFRLMKYFEDVNNHVIHFPFDLGNICIVSTDADGGKCYSRGKIVKIEENKHMGILHRQRIEVLLVDSNQIVSCYSTDLLELPEKFKNFPHQAVDVRIAGIRPQDFDSEWDPKIMVQVIKWIRNQNYAYCQGFIKLSIMNTLWLESVEVIEILHSVTEEIRAVSIKHNLIKGNFCVKDTKPFELLTALADKAELLKPPKDVRTSKSTQPADKVFYNSDTSSIDLDESNDVSLLNWTSTDDDSETSNKPSYKLLKHSSTASAHEEELLCLSKDVWDELALDKFNKVLLCNFYHPNRIYIRNFDSSSRLMELHREIDEFAALPENLTTLTDNTLAQNCLAKINDEFRRAKILKLFHETDYVTAEVFFVDLGEFLMIPTNELFEIPQHFITTLPFQAIFCALIGICPIDSESWCDTICDDIYDNFLGNQSYVYVRSVQPGGPDKYAYGLKSSSYRVVLRDETQDVNVNNWIVTNNFGKFDPSTKHWIDADVGEYAPENEVDFDFEGHYDVQFDEEDLIKFIQAAYGDEQAEKCPAVREETDKEQAKPSPLVDATPDSGIYSAENSLTAMNNPIIELVSVFKFPKIKWHQLDSLIVLTIYAPDVKDYYLKVKARFVYVYFEIEDMKFAAALNLFGCVNSERTSHEIRGLNIVVRLTKTLSKLSWPRLVQAKEKCHWLHYNLDNLRDKPKNFDRKETKKQFVAECSDTSSTDGEFDDELDADSDSYCGSDNETENQQFE